MKQAGRCSLKEHGWGFLLRTRRTSCQCHRLRLRVVMVSVDVASGGDRLSSSRIDFIFT